MVASRAANRKDPHSLSNSDKICSTHVEFSLTVNFDEKRLKGWVEHSMLVKEEDDVVVFDTNGGLDIIKAEVEGASASFTLLPKHEIFGTPVSVSLSPKKAEIGKMIKVKLYYSTSPDASSLQWLPPEQTAEKKYPYLFSQCQAIHARSMFPCQDAPAVKVTYAAEVLVPAWATVLMSALQGETSVEASGMKRYSWKQSIPIPSYLVAIAVGQLESREISDRCRVWSEPSVVDAAHHDFDQTEEFLVIAESLAGKYVWGRYDLLCLPPSFPYGGMENPCLTFITPTLLAGDRSLADVVAHEISHSWTGNLVTNHTWEHFWLNEGWTMWLQRKIMTNIHKDKLFYDLDAAIGWERLVDDIAAFSAHPELTALIPPLDGIDPDDSFSSVPYEKGFFLLYELEKMVGAPKFEAFANYYIQTYKFKTITSEEFKDCFMNYFKEETIKGVLEKIDWDKWFYTPGLTEAPNLDKTLAKNAETLSKAWLNFEVSNKKPALSPAQFAEWSTTQKILFLEGLLSAQEERSKPIPVPVLETIDSAYGLSSSRNSEIIFRWNKLCLKAGAAFIVPNTVSFVTRQGRMKFVRPLYRDMFNSPMARQIAIDTFLKNYAFYHPICRKMVAQDLQLTSTLKHLTEGGGEVEEAQTGKAKKQILTTTVCGVFVAAVAIWALVVVKRRSRK